MFDSNNTEGLSKGEKFLISIGFNKNMKLSELQNFIS
jgi:hypothetical protein